MAIMETGTTGHEEACQSVHSNLARGSYQGLIPTRVRVLSWCLRHLGPVATGRLVWSKINRLCGRPSAGQGTGRSKASVSDGSECLNLQPGELVQVKSQQEVLATLDEHGRHRGLLWMPGMARFCGKTYRVHKRVETIMLESTGELRKIRHTVLLADVMCENLYGCDRSCFHYWREGWLRRVPSSVEEGRLGGKGAHAPEQRHR
jgi:hypothetical protein